MEEIVGEKLYIAKMRYAGVFTKKIGLSRTSCKSVSESLATQGLQKVAVEKNDLVLED